jgi:Type III restriction enzyme, res subunit
VSPNDLESFLSAIGFIKVAKPDFHSYVVSTSGFTERVVACGRALNYDCITACASDIIIPSVPTKAAQHKTDMDCITTLRPCQQEALDAMVTSIENDCGHFKWALGLPPGAGKALMCMLFCVQQVAQNYNTIIIASPLRSQVAQTKARFDALLTHCGVKYISTLVDTDGDTSVDSVCVGQVAGAMHYIHTTFKSAEKVAEQYRRGE